LHAVFRRTLARDLAPRVIIPSTVVVIPRTCWRPEHEFTPAAHGTVVAGAAAMAAVMCLVFLPALSGIGFMFKVVQGDLSIGSAMAGIAFSAMAGGIFVGLFNMSRGWDHHESGDVTDAAT
jgi:hypothetical protein